MQGAVRRVRENAFHVLGLGPEAGRAEVEQQGQKLLAMLEIGFPGVEDYATPVGPARRSADDVRRALAELRDPEKRLAAELWAVVPPGGGARVAAPAAAPAGPDVLALLGWRR